MLPVDFRIGDGPSDLHRQVQPQGQSVSLDHIFRIFKRRRWLLITPVVLFIGLGIVYLMTTPKSYVASATILLDAGLQRNIAQAGGVASDNRDEQSRESTRLVITSDEIARRVVRELDLLNEPGFLSPPTSLTERLMGRIFGTIGMGIATVRGWITPLLDGSPETASMGTPGPDQPEDPAQSALFEDEATDAPLDAPFDTGLGGDAETSAESSDAMLAVLRADAMERQAARMVRGRLSVHRVGRSSAISINFTSRDPEIAARIVNAVADAYMDDVRGSNRDATEQTTEWMRDRLLTLEQDATDAAAAAERFRVENGLVAQRGGSGISLNDGSMTLLNTRMAEAMSEVASARAQLASIDALIEAGPEAMIAERGLGTGQFVSGDAQALQRRLVRSLELLAQVERATGANRSPAQIAQARQRVDQAAEQLIAVLRQRQQALQLELDVAEAKVSGLTASLNTVIDSTADTGVAEVEYRALLQRAETLSAIYQSFLSRFQELEQQSSFPVTNMRLLSRAELPVGVAGPRGASTLLKAMLVGLMIGLVLLARAEWRDRFLRTREDVTDETGAAFLGYLPKLESLSRKAARMQRNRRQALQGTGRPETRIAPENILLSRRISERTGPDAQALSMEGAAGAELSFGTTRTRPLTRSRLMQDTAEPSPAPALCQVQDIEVLAHPASLYAEALRSIRLAADMKWMGDGAQVIGITAARPGEGKSTTALNLAAAAGMSDARVLLIDCDIRNPGLTRQLGVKTEPGLIEVLLGRAEAEAAMHRLSDHTRVQCLPCVPMKHFSHSAELLSSRAMKDLLDRMRPHYEYIILDLSPLAPVVDARAMMRFLDHAVLVASWGDTPRTMLRRLIRSNPLLQDRLLGTVLNRVDMDALPDYVDMASADAWLERYGDYIERTGGEPPSDTPPGKPGAMTIEYVR